MIWNLITVDVRRPVEVQHVRSQLLYIDSHYGLCFQRFLHDDVLLYFYTILEYNFRFDGERGVDEDSLLPEPSQIYVVQFLVNEEPVVESDRVLKYFRPGNRHVVLVFINHRVQKIVEILSLNRPVYVQIFDGYVVDERNVSTKFVRIIPQISESVCQLSIRYAIDISSHVEVFGDGHSTCSR